MSTRPVTDLLAVFVPPALWFAHFGTLYGAEALLCTPPAAARGALVWIGALVTVAALAALAWVCAPAAPATVRRSRRRAHRCGILAQRGAAARPARRIGRGLDHISSRGPPGLHGRVGLNRNCAAFGPFSPKCFRSFAL
jgi:hypothetical protein